MQLPRRLAITLVATVACDDLHIGQPPSSDADAQADGAGEEPVGSDAPDTLSTTAQDEDGPDDEQRGELDGGALPSRWRPASGTSWQIQLSGALDYGLAVAVHEVDLATAPHAIAALQYRGRAVICSFSAGTREDYRSDAREFATSDYGKIAEQLPGERWLDIRSSQVRAVMRERFTAARARGCDGVEVDRMNGYEHDTGFALTLGDQLAYGRFLAQEAHQRGLSLGLRNAAEVARALQSELDWALTESCLKQGNCGRFAPFVAAGKAVLHVEYADDATSGSALRDRVCGLPAVSGFSTLIKEPRLGPERWTCSAAGTQPRAP